MDDRTSTKDILLAILCNVLWGTPTVFLKEGYRAFGLASSDFSSIWVFGGLRIFLAGCVLMVISAIRNKGRVLPHKGIRGKVAGLSLLHTTIVYALFFLGVASTTGTNATIITSTNVFAAAFMSRLFFRNDAITAKKLIGFALGFAGILLCLFDQGAFRAMSKGELMVLVHVVLFALGSTLAKKLNQTEDVLVVASWNYVIGGGILVALGLAFGGRLENWNLKGALILAFLVLVSTVCFYLWNSLLLRNNISQVGVFQLCNPIVSFTLSVAILNEASLQARYIGALALVIAGILVVTLHKGAKHGKAD